MKYKEIISFIKSNFVGRFAGKGIECLLDIVEVAGDGNYLEIGVLYGGSLCSVALLKKRLGHKGVCVGVDMFNGWYGKQDKTKIPVTMDIVRKNIKTFGLDNVKLIKAKSPNFETSKTFVVSFIDGDHHEKEVWADWLKVKDITTRFVVFHDYNKIRGVTKVCNKIDWDVYYKSDFMFVAERK